MPSSFAFAHVCSTCSLRALIRRDVSKQKLPRAFRSYTRPSIAPKPVLDIKHITRNPGLYAQNCEDRNYKDQADNAWKVLELTEQRAKLQQDIRHDREANNARQQRISKLQKGGKEATKDEMKKLIDELKTFKQRNDVVAKAEQDINDQIDELAIVLPNLSSTHTPNGNEPAVIFEHIAPAGPHPGNEGPSHVEIGHEVDVLDFAASANTSGWGWYYLKGHGALLEQALVQYAIDTLSRRGWTLVSPPSVVYTHIAEACGFRPRDQGDEQQIYNIEQKDKSKPGLSLAATAEIPLAAMKAKSVIDHAVLPLKCIAASRCYRAEAGARGVGTRGLYRVHEFTKVEMFAWTTPDHDDETMFGEQDSQASAVFEEMLDVQKNILQSLGLTFRVLEMPATDLGSPASRKQDMEVYFPSRVERNGGWGEVTSTSICTDYQSRRLETRVKKKSGGLAWPYTINGTAMAVPRIIAALLETHWNEKEKAVRLPGVLEPYMFGHLEMQRAERGN